MVITQTINKRSQVVTLKMGAATAALLLNAAGGVYRDQSKQDGLVGDIMHCHLREVSGCVDALKEEFPFLYVEGVRR